MKKDLFKIYIDRLKNENTEKIFEAVNKEVLSLEAKELSFAGDITVSGKAYLANDHLIIDGKIKATALMPCAICNEPSELTIEVNDFSQTIEISEIKGAIYDYLEDIRAAILLKVPHFFECSEGKCPDRKDINQYLKKAPDETHTPFSDLSL